MLDAARSHAYFRRLYGLLPTHRPILMPVACFDYAAISRAMRGAIMQRYLRCF